MHFFVITCNSPIHCMCLGHSLVQEVASFLVYSSLGRHMFFKIGDDIYSADILVSFRVHAEMNQNIC